jgi:hypothetical protein
MMKPSNHHGGSIKCAHLMKLIFAILQLKLSKLLDRHVLSDGSAVEALLRAWETGVRILQAGTFFKSISHEVCVWYSDYMFLLHVWHCYLYCHGRFAYVALRKVIGWSNISKFRSIGFETKGKFFIEFILKVATCGSLMRHWCQWVVIGVRRALRVWWPLAGDRCGIGGARHP